MIQKASHIEGGTADAAELEKINRQTLRPLSAEEVFVFRIAACDDQVDRDFERFTERTLHELAELYVGKTVVMDHNWTAKGQTARIYAAEVEQLEGRKALVLRAYMLRSAQTEEMIAAIEGGILREVSVGCSVVRRICSVCGREQSQGACGHYPGQKYHGQVCHMDLDGAADAYELSFVAVPAQKDAGIIKRYAANRVAAEREEQFLQAQALLELEKIRFGG